MRYLITGGAGFVGSHLAESIASQKESQIDVVDNFEQFLYPAKKRLEWAKRAEDLYPNINILNINMAEIVSTGDYDVIYNCAAIPGLAPSFDSPERYWKANVLDLRDLLRKGFGDRAKFIHLSTSSVYGEKATGDESSPTHPVSPYGESKLRAERLLMEFGQSRGLDIRVARLFSVFGPRQRDDMAYTIFVKKMLEGNKIELTGDGLQSRTNTYVGDAIRALRLIEQIPWVERGFEVFNVAGRESLTLSDALSAIARLLDRKPSIEYLPKREGDQRETRGDTGKLRSRTGWSPETSFESGIKEQVSFMLGLGAES